MEQLLKKLAIGAGLEIERIVPFNRISTIPWYINSRLFRKRTLGRFQFFILNLLTPLFKKIDRFLPLPSLSYIAVLKKNE